MLEVKTISLRRTRGLPPVYTATEDMLDADHCSSFGYTFMDVNNHVRLRYATQSM
jgi:hypothetical protein